MSRWWHDYYGMFYFILLHILLNYIVKIKMLLIEVTQRWDLSSSQCFVVIIDMLVIWTLYCESNCQSFLYLQPQQSCKCSIHSCWLCRWSYLYCYFLFWYEFEQKIFLQHICFPSNSLQQYYCLWSSCRRLLQLRSSCFFRLSHCYHQHFLYRCFYISLLW